MSDYLGEANIDVELIVNSVTVGSEGIAETDWIIQGGVENR